MSEETSDPICILLAEDNPADIYLIRRALAENNVSCLLQVVLDGNEALSLLRAEGKFAGAARPQLILLDLNLPRHDGMEILQHVRQDRQLAAVPVIVFTSSDSPADRLSATHLGVDRFIKKSSLLDEFMAVGAVIREVLTSPSIGTPEN
jgi:two-component system, chemotaxis family, response regulator Rcp1